MRFSLIAVLVATQSIAAAELRAASQDAVDVRYVDGTGLSAGINDPQAGVLSYDIVFGDRLMAGRYAASDDDIAKSIDGISRSFRKLFVTLGVDEPSRTTLASVGKSVDRVRRLIAKHSAADCKVTVVIFPITTRAEFTPNISKEPASADLPPTADKAGKR